LLPSPIKKFFVAFWVTTASPLMTAVTLLADPESWPTVKVFVV
jgi:hypothetical protein